MEIAERVQRVTLLLQTLNDPYPTPRIAVVPDSGPSPSRYVPCETCSARGEVRVVGGYQLCLICDGRGWKRREREQPWDAYLGMALDEANQLPRATTVRRPARDGEEAFLWERIRERYDANGSYAQVRRQLDWLALAAPRRHRLVEVVHVEHQERQLDRHAQRDLDLGVLQLTLRLGRVRVPAWLIEQTAADRRRQTLAGLIADGLTPGQIARRLGVPKKVVQRQLRRAA